jgi:hypothetical protein
MEMEIKRTYIQLETVLLYSLIIYSLRVQNRKLLTANHVLIK